MNGITAAKRGFVLGVAGAALYGAFVGVGPLCCGAGPDPVSARVIGAMLFGVVFGVPVGAIGASIGAMVFCRTDEPETNPIFKPKPHPFAD